MSEAGGQVMEGMGRPEARPVFAVKKGLAGWFEKTFTPEGRAKYYTTKQLNQMASVVEQLHLTDEQKQTMVKGLLEKNLSRAKSNMVREAIGSAIVLTFGGVALWKDWGGARTFITREVPGFVVSIPGRVRDKKEDILGWMQETRGAGVRERVGHFITGFRSGFQSAG